MAKKNKIKPYWTPIAYAFSSTSWRHPIQKIRFLFKDIQCFFHRGRYGWCYYDWFNMDIWFYTVIPQMIRDWQEYGCGYQETYRDENGVEHKCDENEWKQFILSIADDIEKCKEDYYERENKSENLTAFYKRKTQERLSAFKRMAYNFDGFWD